MSLENGFLRSLRFCHVPPLPLRLTVQVGSSIVTLSEKNARDGVARMITSNILGKMSRICIDSEYFVLTEETGEPLLSLYFGEYARSAEDTSSRDQLVIWLVKHLTGLRVGSHQLQEAERIELEKVKSGWRISVPQIPGQRVLGTVVAQ